MSGEAAILKRTWAVGNRTCTLSVPRPETGKARAACVEWEPSPPFSLTSDEWHQYRAGRNSAIAEIAEELGITVAVLEV